MANTEHNNLVQRAKLYLIRTCGCNPVFTEQGSARGHEIPDVIGWKSGLCTIIECKVSLGDLKADQKKIHRRNPQLGMGNYRFYMVTPELWETSLKKRINEMIEDHWGVLVGGKITYRHCRIKMRNARMMKSNIEAERDFLRSRILEIQRFGK